MFDYTSIKAFHTALQNGQTTCVEAVLFYIQAIKENAHLNAFLELYETEALQRAKELDAAASGGLTGPLHGVVIGLKDVIAHKGHTLTASSKMLGNFQSLYNATARLNYRGGSFLIPNAKPVTNECLIRGVSYEIISDAQSNAILTEIASPEVNQDAVKLEKAPKIAVYSPKTKQPWDDAVTLVLTYAEIPYDVVYDEELLNDKLKDYDWLHL